MENYKKGPIIGEGTYGSVCLAEHKPTGRQVAIKKVRMCGSHREGINMSVLRELKALRALASPHVVELLDVFSTKGSLVLVFEFMDFSLEDVLRDKSLQLGPANIKAYMQMLLRALAFVHEQQVAHRDIKPDNLLLCSSNGVMKLADFGLARSLTSSPDNSRLTPQVFGRWYRPPELLMGCDRYNCGVDMWAAGCVLAELLLRRPWFPGNCDMDQLDRIFKALGVPTVEVWPGLADLPHRIDFRPAPGTPMTQMFPGVAQDCLDLLQRLMAFDPKERLSAAAALQHPYFSSSPPPTPPANLPKPQACRGSRNAAGIPAMMHDLFMRPAMMLRQQQGAYAAAAGDAAAAPAPECFVLHRAASTSAWAAGEGGTAAGNAAGDAGPNRCLPAFSEQTSFSGRLFGSQPLQALQPQRHQQQQQQRCGSGDGLIRLMSGSGLMQQQQQGASRLGQGSSLAGMLRSLADDEREAAGQAAGLQQSLLLERRGSGSEEAEVPWKGRLSFGAAMDLEQQQPQQLQEQQEQQQAPAGEAGDPQESSRDDAAAAAAEPAAGGAGEAVDGSSGQQQQQQDGWRRPSPALQQGKQAGGSGSSMRPPLHRTTGQGTPVLCSNSSNSSKAAVAAAGPGAEGAAGRRQVSDLAAALSSAAGGSGASASAPGSLFSQQQQQQDAAAALDALLTNTSTPAAVARRIGGDGRAAVAAAAGGHTRAATAAAAAGGSGVAHEAPVVSDSDGACPMSLGTSAHKRSRAVFEAVPGDQQQEQQQQAGSHSGMCTSGRRVKPGRRSSIGTGCCSMDTDGGQPSTAGGAADSCREDSLLPGGVQQAVSAAGQQQQDQQLQQHKDADLEALLAGSRAVQPGQQQQLGSLAPARHPAEAQAGLRPLPVWARGHPAAGAAATAHAASHHVHFNDQSLQQSGSHAAAAAAAQGAGTSGGCHHPQHGCLAAAAAGLAASSHCGRQDSSGPGSSCPMSLDQQHRAGSSAAHSCGMSIPPSTGLTGRAPPPGFHGQASNQGLATGEQCGLTGGGLAGMDPADLAELAQWWRPRLDSAERRYLRCRKLQMDEALLQASQPEAGDDDDVCAADRPQCSPDAFSLRGALFDTPTPVRAAKQQQQALQGVPPPVAAAAADPAAASEVLPGCQGTAVTAA